MSSAMLIICRLLAIFNFIMTIKAAKFTPEVLLEAPRRSVGVPNSDASKIMYSVSTYSFAEHAKKSEIRVLCAESHQSTLITDDASASEPNWIDDETIVFLKSEKDGTTSITVGDPSNFESRQVAGNDVWNLHCANKFKQACRRHY
jgi:hypothetical protein